MTEAIRKIQNRLKELKCPSGYYAGQNPWCLQNPREILAFHRNQPFNHPPLTHHRFMLVLCLSGAGGIILDGRLFLLEPGWAMMVFPYQSHHYPLFEEENISWLFITFELQEQEALLDLRERPLRISEDQWPLINSLLESFLPDDRQSPAAEECAGWLIILLSRLLKIAQLKPQGQSAFRHQDARAADQWLTDLIRHIHRNAQGPLRGAQLAGLVSMSESHLRRVFRQRMGMTLGQFIRQTRIQRSCSLLHSSNLNISQIALECGFDSVYSLSRAFRREVGLAPTEYRRRVRRAPREDSGADLS
jgi:AraC-like DNA-binding protein